MTTARNKSRSFFKDLSAYLTGHLVLPEDATYEQVRQLWKGEFGPVQRRSFGARMRRMPFTPFVGRVRMDVRSPFMVADMISQEEPCARMAS